MAQWGCSEWWGEGGGGFTTPNLQSPLPKDLQLLYDDSLVITAAYPGEYSPVVDTALRYDVGNGIFHIVNELVNYLDIEY